MANAFSVKENSVAKYTSHLVDQDGNSVGSTGLTTLTLTLYNYADSSIINSRDGQNVLNANNVAVGNTGDLVWSMQQADNPIVDTTNQPEFEAHVALWEWTWDGGTKGSVHETEIVVENFTLVP